MQRKPSVLLASPGRDGLDELSAAVSDAASFECRTRLIDGAGAQGLFGSRTAPDLIVLRLDSANASLLGDIAAHNGGGVRTPIVVVGPADDSEAVRLAFRCGARDFLPAPVSAQELRSTIERVLQDQTAHRLAASTSDVTVVIGAAGGVGTSFVACNLAHAFARDAAAQTLLIDLDVNDAPLAGFLDLTPKRGLVQALEEVRYLDEHALTGYVTPHHSGLHLLGAPSNSFVAFGGVDPEQYETLMKIVARRYRHVVIDGLHGLPSVTQAAIGTADTVLVVLQQSVVQLRQAARLLRILSDEMGFPPSRTFIVLNRYRKNTTVALGDVERALGERQISTIPSHYPTVHASIDGGVPLGELERTSTVSRAIGDLQRQITGAPTPEPKSLLRRAFPIFSGA